MKVADVFHVKNPEIRALHLTWIAFFITFYVWVAWKEPSLGARILWFTSVIMWGNFAMAVYMLIELFRIKHIDQLSTIFGEQRDGKIGLPLGFTLAGLGAYALGAGPLFS